MTKNNTTTNNNTRRPNGRRVSLCLQIKIGRCFYARLYFYKKESKKTTSENRINGYRK